jgi:hypothetical protein
MAAQLSGCLLSQCRRRVDFEIQQQPRALLWGQALYLETAYG